VIVVLVPLIVFSELYGPRWLRVATRCVSGVYVALCLMSIGYQLCAVDAP